MAQETKTESVNPVGQTVLHYREQSLLAKNHRMQANRRNFDCFHMRADWSHKIDGQSREFLPKQQTAVEQITNFLSQGLVEVGEWFRITKDGPEEDESATIPPIAMQKILSDQLNKNDFIDFIDDSLKTGLLGSVMIAKVGGKLTSTYRFVAEERVVGDQTEMELKRQKRDTWRLKLSLVRQEDFHMDPTGDGLYRVEDIRMDWHELKKLATENPDEFDMGVVDALKGSGEDFETHKKNLDS